MLVDYSVHEMATMESNLEHIWTSVKRTMLALQWKYQQWAAATKTSYQYN